jgi:hypothetical protein
MPRKEPRPETRQAARDAVDPERAEEAADIARRRASDTIGPDGVAQASERPQIRPCQALPSD